MSAGSAPLSARERSALIRILSASVRGVMYLDPRQREALQAYTETMTSWPLSASAVVESARDMIRVWAEVGAERVDVSSWPGPETLEITLSERPTDILEPVTPSWASGRGPRIVKLELGSTA